MYYSLKRGEKKEELRLRTFQFFKIEEMYQITDSGNLTNPSEDKLRHIRVNGEKQIAYNATAFFGFSLIIFYTSLCSF